MVGVGTVGEEGRREERREREALVVPLGPFKRPLRFGFGSGFSPRFFSLTRVGGRVLDAFHLLPAARERPRGRRGVGRTCDSKERGSNMFQTTLVEAILVWDGWKGAGVLIPLHVKVIHILFC